MADLQITSFHANGQLSWTYQNSNAVYRIAAETNSGFNQSIFVSASSGTNVASAGGLLDPCRTIEYGIQRAVATGRTRVNVAAGACDEARIPAQPLLGDLGKRT